MSRKLLFLSTPVGFLGSGGGGGVELTLYNLARTLTKQGYAVRVVAPEASRLQDIPLITIAGNAQISAQSQDRQAPILMPENAVLANMWHYAQQVQHQYDLIVNFDKNDAATKDWNAYRDYSPEKVMPIFKRIFKGLDTFNAFLMAFIKA